MNNTVPIVDMVQAKRIGRRISGAMRDYIPDSFTDPRYYPGRDADDEQVAFYFLVMVAMDHRLSRPGRPYEARLSGEGLYHGADLLYRLGARMLQENPGFFTVKRLAHITPGEVRAWLCAGSACPPDAELRAALLRDLARKLKQYYGGSVLKLIEESQGYLHTWDPRAPGLVERLTVFQAYNDPVEKKAMLLAKFLERRGLLRIHDTWNKRVPVDNHLVRIALRTGIVVLERELEEKILSQRAFTPWEDILLRVSVREAWHRVALEAGADDFILDDILWAMGRRVCVRGNPHCRGCRSRPVCNDTGCVLADACPVALRSRAPLNEHLFLNTYWY